MEGRAQRPSVDSTLKIFIELFSVVTAFSFVAAAALLYSVFFIWNLDFFALATVSDVVMGGVFFLLATFVFATCYFAFFLVVAVLRSRERVLTMLALFLLTLSFGALHLLAYFDLVGRLSTDEISRFFRLGLVLAGLILAIYAATVRGDLSRNVLRGFASDWRKSARGVGLLLAMSVPLGVFYFASFGFGRTYLVDKDRLGCPSDRVHLMWMGSSSVVFRCGDRFRAIIGYEDILLRSAEPARRDGEEQAEDYLNMQGR
jgi:hypothetical protein